MKQIAIGAHLLQADIEPIAVAIPVGDLYLSAVEVAADQPLGDRDLLVRVAGIRARLLDVATFVAIRYGFTRPAPPKRCEVRSASDAMETAAFRTPRACGDDAQGGGSVSAAASRSP